MVRKGLVRFALVGLMLGGSAIPGMAKHAAPTAVHLTVDQKAAADTVHRFYSGYDRRDPAIVGKIFSPDAGVVQPDGRQTGTKALERMIGDTAQGQTHTSIAKFEFAGTGPVMVAAFDRTVSRNGPNRPVVNKYRESWFLQRAGAGWRTFWVNYVPYGSDEKTPPPTRPAAHSADRPPLQGDEELAVRFVEGFFNAYKDVNVPALHAMFLPRAKIVHMIALEQSVDDFAHDLQKYKEPKYKYPRLKPAPFDNFTFRKVGNFILVVFDNHVSHWRDGHPEIEHTFRENWLLEKTPTGMKDVWATYSLYGADTPNIARK